MLSPLHGYLERESVGLFKVASATNSGLAMDISASDTSPMTLTTYGENYGTAVPATLTYSFTQSGTTPFAVTGISASRELGWLLQPVSASGPSLLNILVQVYDESVAAGQIAVLVMSKAGALIATDQYLASGTGHIDFTQAPGTICGIASGQPRILQAGDVPRLKLLGAVSQRGIKLASFQVL
jgi:hypothetical protein